MIRFAIFGVVLLALVLWAVPYISDAVDWRACAAPDRIVANDQAERFAKRYIGDDQSFWRGMDVSGREEIEKNVQRLCCSKVWKGGNQGNDPSRWGVSMGGVLGRHDFSYVLFFSECGKKIEALRRVQKR